MAEKKSRKKDYNVVLVATDLTATQASNLIGEISKAKNKVAPHSRITGGITTRDKIGQLLQNGYQSITDGKNADNKK